MQTTRQMRVAAWTALIAVALNVFWSLVWEGATAARPPRDPPPAVQVASHGEHCAMPGEVPSEGHGVPHCAFCTLIGDKAPTGIPAGAWNACVFTVETLAVAPHIDPPRSADRYPPAHSRAPPAFS